MRSDSRIDCTEALALVHRRLDGEAPAAPALRALEAHLERCAGCRETHAELERLQASLRALPRPPLPPRVLQRVWEATSRAPAAREDSRRAAWLGWRAAAAAVVALLLGLLLWWPLGERSDRLPVRTAVAEPTEEDLARAAADVRLVLGMTARALRQTERTAVDRVLAGPLSGALRSTAIRWSGPSGAGPAATAPRKGKDDV